MKNSFYCFIILILASLSATAQKDAQAKSILDAVSQQYQAYNVVKTDFSITVQNKQSGIKEVQTGTLLAKTKANQYKLVIYGPGGSKSLPVQEIICDGKTQWTYTPKDKEVQINDATTSADAMNPSQLFNLYQKGYKYIYNGDQKISGKLYQIIELTPVDAKQSIFKIRLWIDKAKKQIYSAQLFDKNSNRYQYVIRSFSGNVPASVSVFTYNTKEHPGVEVVDLR